MIDEEHNEKYYLEKHGSFWIEVNPQIDFVTGLKSECCNASVISDERYKEKRKSSYNGIPELIKETVYICTSCVELCEVISED